MATNLVVENLQRLACSYQEPFRKETILPAIYVIEPTNCCNLRCIMCPSSNVISKGFMDFSLFRSIVDQISSSAKAVLLYFTGEPLLHQAIVEMVRYCKSKTNARVILSSNATMLDGPLSREIIDSGLDDLIFSLDGNSSNTYERIKRGADFAKVTENITGFIKLKGIQNKPSVTVQFIEMDINRNEVADFVARWKGFNCKTAVGQVSTWACQLPHLVTTSGNSRPDYGPRSPCAELWFKMVINYRGEVVLCCYDYQGKKIIGNLTSNDVVEVWNSSTLSTLRELHSRGQYDEIELCKSCSEWTRDEDEYLYFPEFASFPVGRP